MLRFRRWSTRILLATSLGIGFCIDGQAADAPLSGQAGNGNRPTAALLNVDDSASSTLIERRLLADARATWVERNAVSAILREHQLQTLLGATAVRQRAEVGRLLKADLLVIVTISKKKKKTQMTVCETASGLRVATGSLPLGDRAEPDLVALDALFAQAIARHAQSILQPVAIPPFVSRDLIYDYCHLQGAYARLVEETLSASPRIVAVEFDEAKSIAKELATTDTAERVRRPFPLYLLGEFRHSGKQSDIKVRFRLQVLQGEKTIAEREASVAPSEAQEFLRKTSWELLVAGKESAQSPPDSREEVRLLKQRIRTFEQNGQWGEAAAMIEAALLLDESEELHGDALIAHCQNWGGMSDKLSNEERKAFWLQRYLRGLEHMEAVVRSPEYHTSAERAAVRDAVNSYAWGTPSPVPILGPLDPDVRAAWQHRREVLIRLLREETPKQSPAERPIFSGLCQGLSRKEKFDLAYQFIVEFRDLPGLNERIRNYAAVYHSPHVIDCPEGAEFLARLEQSDDPRIRSGAAALRLDISKGIQWALKVGSIRKPAGFIQPSSPQPSVTAIGQSNAGASVPPAQQTATKPPGSKPTAPPIRLTAVEFPVIAHGVHRTVDALLGCVAASGNTEIAWDRQHLYAIRSADHLDEIWNANDEQASVWDVIFDGKYVWITVQRSRLSPRLLVLDAESTTVREITAEDGLPSENKSRHRRQLLSAAPVSPGCVCVAGSFGRAWLALVTAQPGDSGRPTVDVFHEARRQWDETSEDFDTDPDADFQPGIMVTLSKTPLTDITGQRRIFVPRFHGRHIMLSRYPLIVDPKLRQVSVLSPPLSFGPLDNRFHQPTNYAVHRGSVYLLDCPKTRTVDLLRIDFPAMKPATVMVDAPNGWLISDGTFLHAVGRDWWRIHDDGKVDVYAPVPWDSRARFSVRNRWTPNWFWDGYTPPGKPTLENLIYSRHFGVIVVLRGDPNHRNRSDGATYRVSFDGPGSDTPN